MSSRKSRRFPVLRGIKPQRLRFLLPATYLALVVLSVGGLILWFGLRMQSAALTQAGNDLELQARLVANGLEEPLVRRVESEHALETDDDDHDGSVQVIAPDETLTHLVMSAAASTGGRVTLTDAHRRVIFSSDGAIPLGAEVPASAPEFSTQTRDVRRDAWSQDRRLFVAAPMLNTGGALAGYVQLSLPMASVNRQIAETWAGLFLAGGGVALLTILISIGMAHFILHPIGALTRGADAIAGGDLTYQVRPGGPEELRRLATAFNQMTARLRDMLARQRDFVAHAAHELRTPLTALSLRLELAQAHGKDQPELVDHYVGQMADEIQHLRRLVDHLLALAALDAHELPPYAQIDLAPLLYQVADDFGPLLQLAGHRLQVEVPPHLPPVSANVDQIQAAIRNLLDNAIKYTAPDGTITLAAEVTNRTVRVSVIDTGPGIPPEDIPRIFDRFYRVDKARARKKGGAGLGLALVKGVAEAYGGRVEVESRPGEGSRFTVVLPVAEKATD